MRYINLRLTLTLTLLPVTRPSLLIFSTASLATEAAVTAGLLS